MQSTVKLIILSLAMLIALAMSPAKSGEIATANQLGTIAIIDVPKPTELHLIQLAGLAGRGSALIHVAGDPTCHRLPVRFVAGGFWGTEARITGAPVQLIVKDARAVRLLLQGSELVSDAFDLSAGARMTDADIHIARGLPREVGFVVNPGATGWAEIFGARTREVSCSRLLAAYPLAAR